MPDQRRAEAFHLNGTPSENFFGFQRQVTFSPVARGESFIKFAMIMDAKGTKSLQQLQSRDEVTKAREGNAEFLAVSERYRLIPETGLRVPLEAEHAIEARDDAWGVISAHCDERLPCVDGGRNGSTRFEP
ncbi:hypothetical protein [Microvirga sp. TS319]|uniref:hypothetical protein n=1 Tax=Microvirga sp. TS319 TaxID=3241165 RepID=UPI00351AAF76